MLKLNPNSADFKELSNLTSLGLNFEDSYNTKWSKTEAKNWDLTSKGKVIASLNCLYVQKLIKTKVLITKYYDQF